MLKLLTLTLVVTFLLCLPSNHCAYLVLGPLELTQDNDQCDDGQDTSDKTVPKREFQGKETDKTVTPTIDDDVEVIQDVPLCTNLFRSSGNIKQNKETEKCSSDSKDNCVKPDVKAHESLHRVENKPDKNIDKLLEIDHLKRQLANEREKVRNLTVELYLVKKLCEDSPTSYDYYDYDGSKANKVKPYQSSFDLFNFINSKGCREKIGKCPKCSQVKIDFAQNEKCSSKNDLCHEMESQSESSVNNHLNRNLLNDDIYQIPPFSMNDHKSYKNPNFLNDMPILKSNLNTYGLIPRSSKSMLPFNDRSYHGEDILKTLYPQFFLGEENVPFDFIPHSKRTSERNWIEPSQIYVNNMKQLTAPYKIFPGNVNSGLRFYNIRDRRDNPGIGSYRTNSKLKSVKRRKKAKTAQSMLYNSPKARMKDYFTKKMKARNNIGSDDESDNDCNLNNNYNDESESVDDNDEPDDTLFQDSNTEYNDETKSLNESNLNSTLLGNLAYKSGKLISNVDNQEDDDAKQAYFESEKELDKIVESHTKQMVTLRELAVDDSDDNDDENPNDDFRTKETGCRSDKLMNKKCKNDKLRQRLDDVRKYKEYFCDESKKDWENDERDSEKESVTSKGTDEEVESLKNESNINDESKELLNDNESKEDLDYKASVSIESSNDTKSNQDESIDDESPKQTFDESDPPEKILSYKSSKKTTNNPYELLESKYNKNERNSHNESNSFSDKKTIIEDDENEDTLSNDNYEDEKRKKRADGI